MRRSLKWLPAAIALILLSGCGDTSRKVIDEPTQPGGLVTAPEQNLAPNVNPQTFVPKLLNDVRNSYQAANTMKFDLKGDFISVENGQPASNFVRYAFQKPGKIAIHVVESSDSRTVGTKLLWEGGSKMKVHTNFMGGFWVNVDVDIHDPRTTDQRGYFIDENGVPALMAMLADPSNSTEFLGFATLDGVAVARLGVKSPRSLKGIAREIITIDSVHKLPVMREMYDAKDKMVFRIQLTNIAINTPLPASTFKVD